MPSRKMSIKLDGTAAPVTEISRSLSASVERVWNKVVLLGTNAAVPF